MMWRTKELFFIQKNLENCFKGEGIFFPNNGAGGQTRPQKESGCCFRKENRSR